MTFLQVQSTGLINLLYTVRGKRGGAEEERSEEMRTAPQRDTRRGC